MHGCHESANIRGVPDIRGEFCSLTRLIKARFRPDRTISLNAKQQMNITENDEQFCERNGT